MVILNVHGLGNTTAAVSITLSITIGRNSKSGSLTNG